MRGRSDYAEVTTIRDLQDITKKEDEHFSNRNRGKYHINVVDRIVTKKTKEKIDLRQQRQHNKIKGDLPIVHVEVLKCLHQLISSDGREQKSIKDLTVSLNRQTIDSFAFNSSLFAELCGLEILY